VAGEPVCGVAPCSVVGASAVTRLLPIAVALPLALSHDLGGVFALVAWWPFVVAVQGASNPLRFGFVAGFVEVFVSLWGTADYGLEIAFIVALEGACSRALFAWAIARASSFWTALSLLVVAQGLRAMTVFALPLSVGHDLIGTPELARPAAFGGGALLTAAVAALALSIFVPRWRRVGALALAITLVGSAVHEVARPAAAAPVQLDAAVVQGGVPNWVYAQSWVDPKAAAFIENRYLAAARAAAEGGARRIILPESAVRQPYGEANSMTEAYRALHRRGVDLIAGVNRRSEGLMTNSALIWPAADNAPHFQAKRAIVPIVERDFSPGISTGLLAVEEGVLLLCIESVYPRFLADQPQARWGLVLTNDAGVGWTTARRAFERETRLRAVEYGLSIVRAGQDGATYVVAPTGAVIQEVAPYGRATMVVRSVPGRRATLRGVAGDWVFAAALLWLVLVGLRRATQRAVT
jgi:apolipoprotein N-acyltransferase